MNRQQDILLAIASTSQYLSDVRHLEDNLPIVLARLGQAARVRRAYIYENKVLPDGRLLGSHRLGWSVYRQFMLRDNARLQNLDYRAIGFARWVNALQSGQPIYGDVSEFPIAETKFLFTERIVSIAVIPIISGERCWGIVGFDDYTRERPWSAEEIEALAYVGRAIGTAFETARLFRAEAQRRREAEILNEVSGYLTQSLDLDEAISRALEVLLRHLSGSLTISLTVLDAERQNLTVLAQKPAHRMYPMRSIGQQISLAELPVSQQVLATKRPYVAANVALDSTVKAGDQRAVRGGLRSVLYLPLLVRSESVGVLHIDVHDETHHFSDEEIVLCQGVANLLAAAIERNQLLATERQQLHLAQTLQQVGALLTTQLSLEEVYRKIFSLLAQVIDYDSVSIQLFDEEKDQLQLVASRGFPDETAVKRFILSIAQHCLRKFPEDEFVSVIPDTHTDPRWIPNPETRYIRSWAGALLRVKGRNIGILNVDSQRLDAFDAQALATIAAFANQAAIAIENAHLYENARQQTNELVILNEVALTTAATLDIDELLHQTTQLIVDRIYHESFGFVLVDETGDYARPHRSYHGVADEVLNVPIPLAASVTGMVVQTGKPVILDDVRLEPLYWSYKDKYLSSVTVPLKVEDHVVGVISAEATEFNAYSQDDVRFLTTLSGLIGVAMVRTRLYRKLQEQSVQLAAEVKARTIELQSEKDRTLTILESAGESIILTDRDARILYINRAAEMQSGYARSELLGQTPRLLESGLTPEATYIEMWDTILQGRQWSGELVNRRKDGSLYDVSMTISPILDARREIINFVSVQADITRLKEVDRLKTKFVTNVSHELRTPLTNIKTYVTLLEMKRSENWERYLKVIHHETDRLTQLIQDLLDLSRLETEAPRHNFTAVHLDRVIEEYANIFAAKAEIRQITLHTDVPSGLPPVKVEERHLGQLLTNLLGNAITYTPPGGHVWVKAGLGDAAAPALLWLQITDTGVGIPEKDIPFLFDRFFRSEQVQNLGIPGTGLGLAICHEIVRRYNGRFDVSSQLDQGTSITVWLPTALLEEKLKVLPTWHND
ncbi:MAG: GAF domain-containing protein [Ardenticatenaceae bacterium]|nr:GAF domain-containing protein [Ardenticatenaceae bacterium]MCB8986282.1 GAF domain-containing protein [Ardenticatenaceae bacterium]